MSRPRDIHSVPGVSYLFLAPAIAEADQQRLLVMQRRLCHILARAHGAEIVQEYFDTAADRPRLVAIRRRLRRRDVGYVFVASLELLGDSAAQARLAHAAEGSEAALVSARTRSGDPAFRELLGPILAEFDDWPWSHSSRNHHMGKEERR